MGENSKIEWTHHTFNPWWGCVKASQGCANCYAEAFSKRTGNSVWGENAPRRFFGDKHWEEPRRWNEAARKAGERHRVFCGSMCDIFEDREDLDDARHRLLMLIDDTKDLDWLLLTKRPENIGRIMQRQTNGDYQFWTFADMMPNVWLGTTVENQEMAEQRIPALLEIQATVRFLSCEPLLEPVDLARVKDDELGSNWNTLEMGIGWVIVGGESGPKARPIEADWARSLRDQCAVAGVPFFFKQWGGRDKKAAGHILDGREHHAFPIANAAGELQTPPNNQK